MNAASSKLNLFLRASCIAGLTPMALAPLLKAIFIIFLQGNLLNIESFLYIAVIALIGGLLINLLIGLPVLFLLEKLQLNNIPTVSLLGAVISFLIFVFPNIEMDRFFESWMGITFFCLLGGASGAVASFLSSERKQNQ